MCSPWLAVIGHIGGFLQIYSKLPSRHDRTPTSFLTVAFCHCFKYRIMFFSLFEAWWHKQCFIWTVNGLWSANDSKAFLSSRFSQLLLFCLPYHSIIGMLIELLFSFERIHYENLSSKGLPVSKKTTCISNLIYHLHLLKYHWCDIYSSSFNDLIHFPIPYSFTLSIW